MVFRCDKMENGDLQPCEQVLGMLLIISDPCRCLDPTEGSAPSASALETPASQKSCSLLPVHYQ